MVRPTAIAKTFAPVCNRRPDLRRRRRLPPCRPPPGVLRTADAIKSVATGGVLPTSAPASISNSSTTKSAPSSRPRTAWPPRGRTRPWRRRHQRRLRIWRRFDRARQSSTTNRSALLGKRPTRADDHRRRHRARDGQIIARHDAGAGPKRLHGRDQDQRGASPTAIRPASPSPRHRHGRPALTAERA